MGFDSCKSTKSYVLPNRFKLITDLQTKSKNLIFDQIKKAEPFENNEGKKNDIVVTLPIEPVTKNLVTDEIYVNDSHDILEKIKKEFYWCDNIEGVLESLESRGFKLIKKSYHVDLYDRGHYLQSGIRYIDITIQNPYSTELIDE